MTKYEEIATQFLEPLKNGILGSDVQPFMTVLHNLNHSCTSGTQPLTLC